MSESNANPPTPVGSTVLVAREWQTLALAALRVCHFRPHPRAWWDGEMKPGREEAYEKAMKEVDELEKALGLRDQRKAERV